MTKQEIADRLRELRGESCEVLQLLNCLSTTTDNNIRICGADELQGALCGVARLAKDVWDGIADIHEELLEHYEQETDQEDDNPKINPMNRIKVTDYRMKSCGITEEW